MGDVTEITVTFNERLWVSFPVEIPNKHPRQRGIMYIYIVEQKERKIMGKKCHGRPLLNIAFGGTRHISQWTVKEKCFSFSFPALFLLFLVFFLSSYFIFQKVFSGMNSFSLLFPLPKRIYIVPSIYIIKKKESV